MLTREENELLTRIGPGSAMGRLMRRYWPRLEVRPRGRCVDMPSEPATRTMAAVMDEAIRIDSAVLAK